MRPTSGYIFSLNLPWRGSHPGFMTPSKPPQIPASPDNTALCKHPRVRIVAREEDSEFVECLECGEVFESSEFKDMNIEDTKLSSEF
jgi:hypothetical protein